MMGQGYVHPSSQGYLPTNLALLVCVMSQYRPSERGDAHERPMLFFQELEEEEVVVVRDSMRGGRERRVDANIDCCKWLGFGMRE